MSVTVPCPPRVRDRARVTALTILTDETIGRTENTMTYPPQPPGPGDHLPPPSDPFQPIQPVQAYQPPPIYQPDPYAQQPPPYQQQAQPYDYGYGSPYSAYGQPMAKPPTDGLAIASLIVSCVAVAGLCTWGIGGILGIVGAILGHVSQKRIRNTGASGRGMALAGVIVGWSAAALGLVIIGVIAIAVATDASSSTY